jgi:hypothetical protein
LSIRNVARYSKTLLSLITYDEHGGFYDHVAEITVGLIDGPVPTAHPGLVSNQRPRHLLA